MKALPRANQAANEPRKSEGHGAHLACILIELYLLTAAALVVAGRRLW